MVGVVFVYWIDKVRKRNILFKGLLFGMSVWFLTYTITILFKLKPLDKVSLASAVENFAALIFGAIIAIAYNLLSKKIAD